MEGNNIRIILIGILLTVYLLFGCPCFLHYEAGHVSLVYHFFHANIFHLAVNCLSIWTLFRKGVTYSVASLLWAYIIGSASWFCTSADPVGFSNVIFAIVGMRTKTWKSPSVITFLVITALMSLLPQVSAMTHIVSFILGCIVAGAYRIINSTSRDFRRASYHQ